MCVWTPHLVEYLARQFIKSCVTVAFNYILIVFMFTFGFLFGVPMVFGDVWFKYGVWENTVWLLYTIFHFIVTLTHSLTRTHVRCTVHTLFAR